MSERVAGTSRTVQFMRMVMTKALAETLAMAALQAAKTTDPWWIIGSVAVVLQGGKVSDVTDVDLMMSPHDAEDFLKRVAGERRQPDGSNRFRSLVFGVWTKPPIAVEVFGGFKVAAHGRWNEVSVATREAKTVAGAKVYVPSTEELMRLLQLFGRPKDLARARLLRA